MEEPDLNLLLALNALLAEASVTGAARRLGLSPSATSRTLTGFVPRQAIRCWCAPGAA